MPVVKYFLGEHTVQSGVAGCSFELIPSAVNIEPKFGGGQILYSGTIEDMVHTLYFDAALLSESQSFYVNLVQMR